MVFRSKSYKARLAEPSGEILEQRIRELQQATSLDYYTKDEVNSLLTLYAQKAAADTITGPWTVTDGAVLYDGIPVLGAFWTDLVIEGTAINPPGGAADPTRSTTTGLLEFSASQDNVITGCWQMPHGWAGEFTDDADMSSVTPHLHVRSISATSAPNNVSRWNFSYDRAEAAGNFTNAYGTFTDFATVSKTNPNDTSKLDILSFGDLVMGGSYGASSVIHFKISRLASSDAADTDSSVIVLYSMDLHYLQLSPGTETQVPSGS